MQSAANKAGVFFVFMSDHTLLYVRDATEFEAKFD